MDEPGKTGGGEDTPDTSAADIEASPQGVHEVVTVRSGIGTVAHFSDAFGEHLDRSHKRGGEVIDRGDVTASELISEDHIFVGPIVDHRLVAFISEAGRSCLLLGTPDDSRVPVDVSYGRTV